MLPEASNHYLFMNEYSATALMRPRTRGTRVFVKRAPGSLQQLPDRWNQNLNRRFGLLCSGGTVFRSEVVKHHRLPDRLGNLHILVSSLLLLMPPLGPPHLARSAATGVMRLTRTEDAVILALLAPPPELFVEGTAVLLPPPQFHPG